MLKEYLLYTGEDERSKKIDQLGYDLGLISKCYGKNGKDRYESEYEYYMAMQNSPNASIAKMLDRAHNMMTLVLVKEDEDYDDKMRMASYMAKTLQLQNDYVRECCKNFPSQADTYTSLKQVIEQETQACRYYIVNTGKKITNDNDLQEAMPEKGFHKLPNGFHPLIFIAERIRRTYPETYLENNNPQDSHRKNTLEANDNNDGDNPEI